MRVKRRGIALLVAGAACAGPIAGAAAVEGSLYPILPGTPQVTPPWTAVPGAEPGVWEVAAPAGTVTAGTKVRIPFACPAEGSVIESAEYERLRAAAPSSFGADVVAEGVGISRDPDVDWPTDNGSRRRVPVGGAVCSASIDLVQSETRRQHKRTWFVGAIRAWARDVAAPTVEITSLPGVVGPGAEAVQLRYSVSDNFGADGVGEHRIELNNSVVAGGSGVGQFAVPIQVEALAERDHTVRVVVDGDGTPAGVASRQFAVDRTGPGLIVTATRRGAKRVTLNVRGATDLNEWTVRVAPYVDAQRAGSAGLAAIASGSPIVASRAGAGAASLDLSRIPNNRLFRPIVFARDASGNLTVAKGPFIYTGRRQQIRLTTNSGKIAGPRALRRQGLARRIESGFEATRPLPQTVGIGGRLILWNSDTPFPETVVSVRDLRGRRVAVTTTNGDGKYLVRFRPKVAGKYRLFMEGRPDPVRTLTLFLRPRVLLSRGASKLNATSPKPNLIVKGALRAGRNSANERVFLQQRVGKRWRNVASDFTNENGVFNLVHRPALAAEGRTLTLRVRVPADPRRAFSATTSKRLTVAVAGR